MLSSLLTHVTVPVGETPFIAVDPMTRFVFVMTAEGPQRTDTQLRKVLVPTFDWQIERVAPEAKIAELLTEASASSPLKLPSPKAVDDLFWVRQRGWQGILCHPSMLGKFLIPDGPIVVTDEVVAPNALILVGADSAISVSHGTKQGLITNKASGLMQVQFFVA